MWKSTRVLPIFVAIMLFPICQNASAEGESRFMNPLLPGFHADPSICRVGDDYYLATSSFEYFPGVPIYHSKDLLHWEQIGYALTRKSQLDLTKVASSGGIYAPTIRYHNGRYYLITTSVGHKGNFYMTATDPAGPWSDPTWIDPDGIDPSLFFEGDKVYYTRQVDGRHGYSGQQLLNLQSGQLEGEMKELWRGTGGVWPEGPHLYKVKDKYYLMISEGGTSYEHSLTVARSDSPWGPFEANPDNPILSHEHQPENPFQAMGHGDLVETPDGWWVVFLGIRPQGGHYHHLGRETFLAPVSWNDAGWPVINEGQPIGEKMNGPYLRPHPWPQEPARDDFDQEKLRVCYQFVRHLDAGNYSLTERPGWLRLHGVAATLDDVAVPTFIGRAQPGLECHVATKLAFEPAGKNEEAGLALRGNENNHCEAGLRLVDGKRQIFFRTVLGGEEKLSILPGEVPAGEVIFSLEAKPLVYELYCQTADGPPQCLGALPTRNLSSEVLTAQPGAAFNFTGVYVGLYATGNGEQNAAPADFDWFDCRCDRP